MLQEARMNLHPLRPSAGSLTLVVLAASGCGDHGPSTALDGASPGLDDASPLVDSNPLVAADARPPTAPSVKLLVLSDPHYFDPSLGTTGQAFETYLARDRKLVPESDAVLRAVLAAVQLEKPDAILISGDLTKDGELTSHMLVADYLRQMRIDGRRIFVVPGNHDVENGDARSYSGDLATPVPSISAADFAAIYAEMGYSTAMVRDPGSLSYLAELVPGLWLLAIDSCIYGDRATPSVSSGRLTESTKAWIQAQLDFAKARGVRVLAMMHHGVVEHFTNQALIFPEYLVAERDAVASLLSNGGVGAVFTGHFHANDITQGTPSGASRTIYDIETGSTVTYPCPYRMVDVSGDTLAVTTKHLLAVAYDLKGAPDFQTYAHDSLRLGLETLITNLVQQPPYSMSPDTAIRVSPWLGDGLVAHYAGDEVMPADVPTEMQTLLSSGVPVEMLAAVMLGSVWTDLPPADNTAILDLAAR
jgi:3',5'-cyclic AMP phosphodiesterase CpdA